MNRRKFLVVFGMGAIAASAAAAAPYEDVVIGQLKSQGYDSITVERTLLGRVKITGQINTGRREIILNPRTGEILRDLWLAKFGGSDGPKIRGALDPDETDADEDEVDDDDVNEPDEPDESDEDSNSGEGGDDNDN